MLGDWIGALTLTGSFVAFGKLHGIMDSGSLNLPGKNLINAALMAASLYVSYLFLNTTSPAVAVQTLVGRGGGGRGWELDEPLHPLGCLVCHNGL